MFDGLKKAAKKVAKKAKKTIVDTAKAAGELAKAVVKDAVDVVVHAVKTVVCLATLDFAGAVKEIFEAGRSLLAFADDILFGGVGLILQIGSIWLSAIQTLFGFEDEPRGLSKAEITYLTPIFGSSVDYGDVEIVDGKIGLFNNRGSVVTLGNTIRISSKSWMSPLTDLDKQPVLVHEIVHIWHYQNGGPRYIAQALMAQFFGMVKGRWMIYPGDNPASRVGTITSAPRGYSFEPTLNSGGHWDGLNPEQQGSFIDVAFALSADFANPAAGVFLFPPATGPSYSNQLAIAVSMIQNRRGVPVWPPISLPIV